MHAHITRYCVGALLLGTLVLATACSTITTVITPGSMKVSIDIKDYHMGTTHVDIRFADTSNNTVEFVHGETVTCNGVFLKYDSAFYERAIGYGGYVGEVPLQPESGTYTFIYTPSAGGGTAISIPIKVVVAPVTFTQPTNGSTVPIPTASAPLVTRYQSSGLANISMWGTATDSRVHVAIAFTLNETGAITYNSNDFTQFQPGPGSLSLSRNTTSKPGGTGFNGVDVTYENITTIQITWM